MSVPRWPQESLLALSKRKQRTTLFCWFWDWASSRVVLPWLHLVTARRQEQLQPLQLLRRKAVSSRLENWESDALPFLFYPGGRSVSISIFPSFGLTCWMLRQTSALAGSVQ